MGVPEYCQALIFPEPMSKEVCVAKHSQLCCLLGHLSHSHMEKSWRVNLTTVLLCVAGRTQHQGLLKVWGDQLDGTLGREGCLALLESQCWG